MTCLSAGSQAPRTMTSLAYNNSLAPSSALVLTTILWEKFRYPQNYVQLCAVPIQITEGREYLQPNGGISVSYSMTLDNKIRRYTGTYKIYGNHGGLPPLGAQGTKFLRAHCGGPCIDVGTNFSLTAIWLLTTLVILPPAVKKISCCFASVAGASENFQYSSSASQM